MADEEKSEGQAAERGAVAGPMAVQATVIMTPMKGFGDWTPTKVLKMNGDTVAGELPAKHQLITDGWNREVATPRLVYMPERDKLMLLVHRENQYKQYPPDSLILFSDDHGETWSAPVGAPGWAMRGYLGCGKVLLGDSFSDDYGATWTSRPVPPASNGGPFHQWCDYLVDRNSEGKVTRLVAEGYNSGTPGTVGEYPTGYCHSFFRFSFDEGLTWVDEIEPPSLNGGSGPPRLAVSEKTLCRAANGTIIAACRIKHEEHKDKIDHYAGLGVSLSKDDGHTWSKLKVLYDYGRMHASMVTMPNGDIIVVYDVRLGWLAEEHRVLDEEGFPQWSVEAIVSRDNGESWDLAQRYVLAKWSGSYHVQDTSTVLLPDGSLLTAFGAGYRSEPVNGELLGPLDVALVRWRPDSD